NIISQKQKGYYTFVLHPQGGLLDTETLNSLVSYLEKSPQVQLRLSMEESLYIRNLTARQVKELEILQKWQTVLPVCARAYAVLEFPLVR
ncbi:MAG: hypothetical protein QM793_13200, partial [Muricomes sp.]